MLIIDLSSSDINIHSKFIKYIFSCCDQCSFRIPGYYANGDSINDTYWENYHQKTNRILLKCSFHGQKINVSKNYENMVFGEYNKIIKVKPSNEIMELFLKNPIPTWLSINNLPEDPCFFKNKKIKFFSCTHDDRYIIYDETQKDIELLKSLNVEFWKHNR